MEFTKTQKDELNKILSEQEAKGNICFMDFEMNLHIVPMDKFLEQPIDGILHDLNRDKAVLSTLMDYKFVNDYGMCLLVTEMHKQLAGNKEEINALQRDKDFLIEELNKK